MAKIILCTTKEAKTPFTFLNTKVEVFTYEELCFYIYNNTILISRSMLSEKLFNWIRDELGMEDLASRLYSLLNKGAFMQDMLIEILSAGEYYSPEEIKSYIERWKTYRALTEPEREKLRGDGYLKYHRYIKAATIYEDILTSHPEDMDPVLTGNIWHNRGVAAADNLDTAKAKECFLKAYQLNQNPESLKEYFYVVAAEGDTATLREEIRTKGFPEDYFNELMEEIVNARADVREMTIYAMLQRASFNRRNKDMTDYDKRMDIILGDLKEEFREQTI